MNPELQERIFYSMPIYGLAIGGIMLGIFLELGWIRREQKKQTKIQEDRNKALDFANEIQRQRNYLIKERNEILRRNGDSSKLL